MDAQRVVVDRRGSAAGRDELVEPAELHETDGRVQLAHAPRRAEPHVFAAEESGLALIAVDQPHRRAPTSK